MLPDTTNRSARPPIALTVAGSDPSGGAGIQADLRTFAVVGVYGTAVMTALTAQTTVGVRRIEAVSPDLVAAQLDAVLDDVVPGAVKIGMLATASNVAAVASMLEYHRAGPVVLDPVIRSGSGTELLSADGVRRMMKDLLGRVTLLTPNLDEASRLVDFAVHTPDQMEEAARVLHGHGAAHVLVKGGHLEGNRVVDVFFDGSVATRMESERIPGPSPHGTGCVLSSAIAAHLARGRELLSAIREGQALVRRSIRERCTVGRGVPVADPLGFGRVGPRSGQDQYPR